MKFWLIFILIFFAVRYLLPIVLRLVLSGFVRKQMRNGGFVVPPQARPDGGPPPGPAKCGWTTCRLRQPRRSSRTVLRAANTLILRK